MIPQQLLEFLECTDDEFLISIKHVEITDGNISLLLMVKHDGTSQSWKLRVQPLDYELVPSHVDDIQTFTDHPRLWKYLGLQSSLYFNGLCEEPKALALDLAKTHYDMCGVETHIATHMYCVNGDLLELCSRGHGLFAEGPLRVLERYSECLATNGIRTSLVGTKKASVWGANGWQSLPSEPYLLLLGKSWIIGTTFNWEQLSE